MGVRNYLVEGVSGTGKTSVCRELSRRGFHAINGDTDLAYQGDPETGEPTDVPSHWHHLWDIDKVRALVADEFGSRQPERDLIVRLHRTGEDTPKDATTIDATAPLDDVVDDIIDRVIGR